MKFLGVLVIVAAVTLIVFSLFYGIIGTYRLIFPKKKTFKLKGVTVTGPEEDYFMSNDDYTGMSSLLSKIDISPITWQEASAFEQNKDDSFSIKHKDRFHKRTNLTYPPVYEVTITVCKKKLNEEDSRWFWKDLAWSRYKNDHNID